MNAQQKDILIVTAVEAEQTAVLRGLGDSSRYEVIAAGVGPAAAAAGTARSLARGNYRLVVSAGIGGGFPEQAEVGSLVVADVIIQADLGSETPDGFLSTEELGFGTTSVRVDLELAERLTAALQRAGMTAVLAPIATVSTTTGTKTTADKLAARVPGAAAEGMEGFGAAQAAALFDLPVLELRSISNTVGPRDRDAWNIPEALHLLERASSVLMEVLQ